MTNQAYPTLNGIEPSWADIGVSMIVRGGPLAVATGPLFTMADIAGLKWSRKLEVGKKRGASGGRIMARTTGQVDYDATAQFYRSGVDQLLTNLIIAATAQGFVRGNQVQIGLVSFDLLVQHTPPGSIVIYTTKLKGCRFLGDADDMKEGPDPDKVELTIDPTEISRILNGVEAVLL